jgi:uncharacterized membrane protein (DUF485 family)
MARRARPSAGGHRLGALSSLEHRMQRTTHQLLASTEFRRLVFRRWVVSSVLTAALFVIYYGYVLLVAINKPLMARRIGTGVMTLGIPLGVAVILLSWVLTAVYVVWANRTHDAEVARLRNQLH